MKNRNLIAVAALVLAGAALTARAVDPNRYSFGVTNSLATAVDMRTWPTNSPWSSNYTGGPIDVKNYRSAGFYFEGNVVTAGTGTVTLVRAPAGAQPTTYTNWESLAQLTITVPMPNTGWFTFQTNLDEWFLNSACFVGINRLTNAAGNITNLETGVIKKVMPVRFP